jgi:CheY-like chemotaxis protein
MRRLLVVDDFQPGAEATTALLSMSGYDARFVVDGAAAFRLIIALVPDSVVLDINMPGMDGYAVARQPILAILLASAQATTLL